MKVILGCDPLLMPLTGIGHYTNQIGHGLKSNQSIESLEFFAHGKFYHDNILKTNESLNDSHTGKESVVNFRQLMASSDLIVKCYSKLLPLLTKFTLRNHAEYIYHSPNFVLPNFEGKKITTIHDLSTIRYPQYHPSARVSFVNKAIDDALTYADHIITDSEFVKRELIQLFGGNKNKITAIPLGADQSYRVRGAGECQNVLALYKLKYKEYFLFVSTIEPRKNLIRLLQAYKIYREKSPNGYPLILVGGKGWNNQAVFDEINIMQDKGWVKYLGYINQTHVPTLYSAARALLFPSVYEGFGLPVLEAMQSGTPVLTCKDSSMSEITGSSAVLIEVNDVEMMAKQIKRLSEDELLCKKLSKSGVTQTLNFSWEQCVLETINVYQSFR